MSRLLLAQAARLLGWPPDSWRDGWPDLLTAAEIATLEACDETGKPNPGKKAAVLAVFEACPPAAGGQSPNAPSGPRVGVSRVIADGFKPGLSITTGGYHDPWDGWKPARTVECSPLPAYRAETYRQWAARDWPPAPMMAAWLGQDEAAAMPQEGQEKPEPDPKPVKPSHTQARAERLAAVLDAIEARARECGVPLVRSQWPGTKDELQDFLKWHAPGLSYSLQTDNSRLTDELRPHGVSFLRGNNKGKGRKFYRELFPKYPAT